MKKKVLFHQDNAPYHKSSTTVGKLHELHFELLLHPPFSPDLTPSDYWLFVDLKRMLQRKRFNSKEEVIWNWGVFWGQKQIVLPKRHRIGRKTMESVYHPRRRLCWWIVEFCVKVVVLLVRLGTFWVRCYISESFTYYQYSTKEESILLLSQ